MSASCSIYTTLNQLSHYNSIYTSYKRRSTSILLSFINSYHPITPLRWLCEFLSGEKQQRNWKENPRIWCGNTVKHSAWAILSPECKTQCRKFCASCCSCRWGETMSLNCGNQRAYCSSPRWYMSMESHDAMILTGKIEELGEKPVPVPLCSTQISHGLTRERTLASAVRGRRLAVWAMAQPRNYT
jgi:hypothetical protein